MSTTTVAAPVPLLFDQARLAVAGFLARYSGPTRIAYTTDLRQYFAWCADQGLDVFAARRGHIELWARSMEERGLARATVGRRLSTVSGFYRFAVVDGLLAHSPAEFVRRPKISTESATLGLDRMELGAFIACGAAGSPTDHALACLLGLLGLRVSEACSIDVEHLGMERGHRIVTVLGKGSKLAVIPLPPRIARALDLAAGERRSGPLLLARSGRRLNRHAATRIVRRLAKAAGITKHIPRKGGASERLPNASRTAPGAAPDNTRGAPACRRRANSCGSAGQLRRFPGSTPSPHGGDRDGSPSPTQPLNSWG